MKKNLYLSGLLLAGLSLGSLNVHAQAPVVTLQPENDTVCAGSLAKFVGAATGATSYRWFMSTNMGATWDTVHNSSTYAGATTDTLKVTTTAALNGNMYKLRFINTSGIDSSNGATLTVDVSPTVAAITGATNVCVGNMITVADATPGGTWSHTNSAVATFNTTTGVLTGTAVGFDTIKYRVTNTCGFAEATAVVHIDASGAAPITGPTATCVGNSISLMNANNIGTGVWSSSNAAVGTITGGTGSATFTGTGAGVTAVTYSFTNACGTYTSSASISVSAPLTAPTLSQTHDEVCAGSWVSVTPSSFGGVWISSNSAVAVVDMSGNITGIAQGTAYISYIMSNACGSVVAVDTVTVDVPAASITGVDSVGIGNTITLANTTLGGIWSSSDASIGSISTTGVVSGLDTGVITVSYSVTNACGTSVATHTVNVGPAPDAGVLSGSNPDSVCVGTTKTITSTVPGGVWSMVNPKATITSAGVITGVTYGMDTVMYTVTNAFGTTTKSKRIFVNEIRIDSVKAPAILALGGDYDVVGWPAGGVWSITNHGAVQLINTSSTGHIVITNFGNDTLTYTLKNTCGTKTQKLPLHIGSAGVGNIANGAGSLTIFPNPASVSATISLQTAYDEDAAVVVTNVVGEKVMEAAIRTNKTTELKLDQPAGIYIVTAKTAGATYTSKITIVR